MQKLSEQDLQAKDVTVLVPFSGVPACIRELLRHYMIRYEPKPNGDQYTVTASRWREIVKAAQEQTND
jgi:hypothetical protein